MGSLLRLAPRTVAPVLVVLAVLGGALFAAGSRQVSTELAQKTCPPCRQSLKSFGHDLHVTWKDQRVYVCCAGCAVKMQLDWDGYVGILHALGETPETVPASRTAGNAEEPVIANPKGKGVCEACRGGACELPEHKPR